MVQIDMRRVLAAFFLLSGTVTATVRFGPDRTLNVLWVGPPGCGSQASTLRAGVASCAAADAAVRDTTIPYPTWFSGWDNELGGSSAAVSRKLMQVCASGHASNNTPLHALLP
jgi:hypothetical protein